MFSKLSDNRWFGSHRKTPLQVVYLMLVFLAIVLTGVRISKIQGPTTRSDTLAIVMGIKSIIIFTYQLITSHVERFRKWGSLRANKILDCMEVVFWFVVVIISFMGVSKRCQGSACALGVIVALIAMILM
ncbi:hypothetical protein SAPIO_CDS7881 [Scedosporium apiospermum]|uniref:Uncharacterized protein n=1 Tax=Pseudallescheria apiosperma TaxID=563466 RepID=A0A084G0M5_PSEDA|nr:uncharacterized protein SAPIO_CDS7881 [Scedosporium apiospermum]KEZ40887.1 hypothetical protein SAPIO_CDS7881 [Scedosporium apiospermum]